MTEELLRKQARTWPEESVLFIEPRGGIPPGQPDLMVWVEGKKGWVPLWVQVELKHEAKRPTNPDPWKLLRPAQKKRAKKCLRRGIPYLVAVLRDPLVVEGAEVSEVEVWRMKAEPHANRSALFEVGRVELEQFNPNTIALLIK